MDKIGPYQILETLHRGPQPLYRVKAADGRVLALKAAPVANSTPESRERFSREAETCRTLDHPHLVRVVDAGEADGMLYQVMDLLDGADLGKVMGEGRQFSWNQKLSIMEQVCDGLQYAHEHRLVHRDIKPANLFLENSGRAVVLDFGMVRLAESELTKVGATVGTVNYMAPEQIRGERCTAASDVFSAGIVFFQLAAGRHPFSTKDRSLAQIVSAIVFEPPPKLSEICPDAPEGLEFLLNRALDKDPARRLQNAGELKQSLALCRLAMLHAPVVEPAPVAEATKVFAAPKSASPAPDRASAAPASAAHAANAEATKVFTAAKSASPTSTPVPAPVAPASAGHAVNAEANKVFTAAKSASPASTPAPAPVAPASAGHAANAEATKVFTVAKSASPTSTPAPAPVAPASAGHAANAEATKVFTAAKSASPASTPAPGDSLTTPSPAPAAPASPDAEKTQVFRRPAASPVAAPTPKPAPPPPVAPTSPQSATGLRFRYCPSCTSANPPDATVCSRCGLPLAEAAAARKSTNWGMYIAAAIATLLAIALIVVLVVKR